MLNVISEASLPEERARAIVDGMEDAHPIMTRIKFMECIAALRATWPEEGVRRLPNVNVTLTQVLLNACTPQRLEWLFNYRRYANIATATRVRELAAGTTSNEAFHRELNSIFDLVHEMYQSTLKLKLRIILFLKGLPQGLVALAHLGVARAQTLFAPAQVTFGRLTVPRAERPFAFVLI